MLDGGVIELNAQISTPGFHLISCKIGAVIGDDAVWNTIMVHHAGYEVYYWPRLSRFDRFGLYPLSEFIHHNQLIFLLVATPLRGPTMSSPQTTKGQVMGIIWRAVGGIWLWFAKSWQPTQR